MLKIAVNSPIWTNAITITDCKLLALQKNEHTNTFCFTPALVSSETLALGFASLLVLLNEKYNCTIEFFWFSSLKQYLVLISEKVIQK